MCLSNSPSLRLACLAITVDGAGQVILTPIPTNDPQVNMVAVSDVTQTPNPNCATCV